MVPLLLVFLYFSTCFAGKFASWSVVTLQRTLKHYTGTGTGPAPSLQGECKASGVTRKTQARLFNALREKEAAAGAHEAATACLTGRVEVDGTALRKKVGRTTGSGSQPLADAVKAFGLKLKPGSRMPKAARFFFRLGGALERGALGKLLVCELPTALTSLASTPPTVSNADGESSGFLSRVNKRKAVVLSDGIKMEFVKKVRVKGRPRVVLPSPPSLLHILNNSTCPSLTSSYISLPWSFNFPPTLRSSPTPLSNCTSLL